MSFGSDKPYNWTHEHLIDVLTKGSSAILKDPLIINAFKRIDRADFVPEEYKDIAYQDNPIEIGYDQSISQPTVVALMLSLLHPREGKKYLDIGAGSGYVSALLGFIAGEKGQVFALERNQYLADFARNNIAKYPEIANRIKVIFGDGQDGLANEAPYDFIHVAAAYKEIPQKLKNQLKVGGKLIAPTRQTDIRLIERVSPSDFAERIIDGFIFVPMLEGIE